jgi:hypothetical protein
MMNEFILKSCLTPYKENWCYERLLPKGWEPSDYDQSENLIEIEDTRKGEKFWAKATDLFRVNFEKDKEVLVKEFRKASFVEHKFICTGFDSVKKRTRYYLLALLEDNCLPF